MLGLSLINRNYPKSLLDFHDIMNDFFDDNVFYFRRDGFKVNVKKKDNMYLIEAELPGIEKENVSLSYENNLLTINVSQTEEIEDDSDYIYRERRSISMNRVIRLDDLDDENIEAKLEDGLLKIRAPILKKTDKYNKIEIL